MPQLVTRSSSCACSQMCARPARLQLGRRHRRIMEDLEQLTLPGRGDARRPLQASAFNPIGVRTRARRSAAAIRPCAACSESRHHRRRRLSAYARLPPLESKASATSPAGPPRPGHRRPGRLRRRDGAARSRLEQFGEAGLPELGIRIVTTVARKDREAAYAAACAGVLDFDRRHGCRGPEAFVELPHRGGVPDEQLDEDARQRPTTTTSLLAALVLQGRPKEVLAYRRGQDPHHRQGACPSVALRCSRTRPRKARHALAAGRSCACAIPAKGWLGARTGCRKCKAALVAIGSLAAVVAASLLSSSLLLPAAFDFHRPAKFQPRDPGGAQRDRATSLHLLGRSTASSVRKRARGQPALLPGGEVTGSKAWEPKELRRALCGTDDPARRPGALEHDLDRLLEDHPDYARDYLARFGFDPAESPTLTMALGAAPPPLADGGGLRSVRQTAAARSIPSWSKCRQTATAARSRVPTRRWQARARRA